MERWLPVVGYEELYEVSDLGRIRSLSRMAGTRGGPNTRCIPGRVLKPGFDGNYCHFTPCAEGIQRTAKIHATVLDAFVGVCPEGQECRHLDGNKRNNRLANLAWGTKKENAADALRHGTYRRGETCGTAKATTALVKRIRKMRATGLGQQLIADTVGLAQSSISSILRRQTWAHV